MNEKSLMLHEQLDRAKEEATIASEEAQELRQQLHELGSKVGTSLEKGLEEKALFGQLEEANKHMHELGQQHMEEHAHAIHALDTKLVALQKERDELQARALDAEAAQARLTEELGVSEQDASRVKSELSKAGTHACTHERTHARMRARARAPVRPSFVCRQGDGEARGIASECRDRSRVTEKTVRGGKSAAQF